MVKRIRDIKAQIADVDGKLDEMASTDVESPGTPPAEGAEGPTAYQVAVHDLLQGRAARPWLEEVPPDRRIFKRSWTPRGWTGNNSLIWSIPPEALTQTQTQTVATQTQTVVESAAPPSPTPTLARRRHIQHWPEGCTRNLHREMISREHFDLFGPW